MNELNFVQIRKDDTRHCEMFKNMFLPYCHETDKVLKSDEMYCKIARSTIDMQGPHDRHLELAFDGGELVGFLYGKVDHENHMGHKKVGYGYVMEFYIKPEFRRRGYGEAMFLRLQRHFASHGVKRMYLNTSAPAKAFWQFMGFAPTDEIQPHNNMVIWEKEIVRESLACRAMTVEDLHTGMMDSFSRYQEIKQVYRKRRILPGHRIVKLRRSKIDNWSAEEKTVFIRNWFIHHVFLRQYYPGQPRVFAAFRGNQVAAFAVWDLYWGKEQGYAVLLRLFVSRECRRMGFGRQLFELCADAARAEGAQKLFISAEPPVETQDFYRSLGCTAAKKRLYGPKNDLPLEYKL